MTPASYRYTTLNNLFDSKKKEVQEYFNDSSDLFLVFDKTTKFCDRYILNILLGKCSCEMRNQPRLITTIKMEKTNSETVLSNVADWTRPHGGRVQSILKFY